MDLATILADARETEQNSYLRLQRILSSPDARRAIARDGVPVLRRQSFCGIIEAEIYQHLEAYLQRITEAIAAYAEGSSVETYSGDTALAVRVLAALNLENYEPQASVVVVTDDQVRGVWDVKTYNTQWFELSGNLNHDRYKAEVYVTRFLGKTSAVIQGSCSSVPWVGKK